MSAEHTTHTKYERIDRRLARFFGWGGLGVAAIGALVGVGAIIIPALISAASFGYYEASRPVPKKSKGH